MGEFTQSKNRGLVTVLAYGFPPLASIGVQRPLRLCTALLNASYDVRVICGNPSSAKYYYKTDENTLKSLDPRMEVTTCRSFHPFQWITHTRDRLRSVNLSQHTSSHTARAVQGAPHKSNKVKIFLHTCLDFFQGLWKYPDVYSFFYFTATPKLLLMELLRPSQVIVSTGPPWTPALVAATVSKILGRKWIMDYRDPWTTNPYHKQLPPKWVQSLETSCIRQATKIWVNNNSMHTELALAFPHGAGKWETQYNGFSDELFQKIQSIRSVTKAPDKGALRIVHAGFLYRERMPHILAHALAVVAKKMKEQIKIQFVFVGTVAEPDGLKSAFAKEDCIEQLVLTGPVSQQVALEEQARAHVLLLLQPGTRVQLPAKIFEYALWEKPILAIAECPGETQSFVQQNKLGQVFSIDEAPDGMVSYLSHGISQGFALSGLEAFSRQFAGEARSAQMLESIQNIASIS